MSTRPYIKPNLLKPLIKAANMATNIVGPVSTIDNLPGISYDITWTGTPTGTFTIQVSNSVQLNPDGSVANIPNWTVLPSADFTGTYPVPSGSAGSGFIDVFGTNAAFVQLIYTAASGSGTLTVYPAAKVW